MNLKKAERTSTSNRKVAETKSGRFVSIQGARAHETPADSSKFHSRKTRNVRKNHPTVDVHVSENSCQECLPPASPKTDTKARGPNKRPTLERLWNVCVNKSEVKNFPQMLDTILQSYRKLPEFVHFLASQNKFEIPYGDRRYFAKFNHAAKQIEITADEASTVSSSGLLELRSKSEEVATCDNDACVLQMPAINTNVLFRDEKLVKLQALWAAQGGSKGQTNKMVLTVNLNGDREYCLLVSLRASKDLQKGNESGLSYTFQDSQTAEWLQVHMNSFSVKGTTPNQPSYSSPARKCSEYIHQTATSGEKNKCIGASVAYQPATAMKCITYQFTVRSTAAITSLKICPRQNKGNSQTKPDADAWCVIHQPSNLFHSGTTVPSEAATPPPVAVYGQHTKQTTSRNLPLYQEEDEKCDDNSNVDSRSGSQ